MKHGENLLADLYAVLQERKKADPASSYVASLFAKGDDAILKKIAEEAAETLLAAKNRDRAALLHELADLWFHSLVLMAARDIAPVELEAELVRRSGRSGLEEKATRTK